MLALRAQFAFVLALAGMLWWPAGSCAQNPQVQEQSAGLTPTGPASALAQIASGQTVVRYQNGKLTIMARNAPLSDVLRAVCAKTGAVLDDVPPGADQPIFATLGPGRAREVLASLLNDARFDYVIVGPAGDPNGLARIMVFPKTKSFKTENKASEPATSPVSSASGGATPPPQKQAERPIQAQARADNSQAENRGVGDSDLAGVAADPDVANILLQIQAQIKAAAPAAEGTNTGASQNAPQVNTGGPQPAGRQRHRRH